MSIMERKFEKGGLLAVSMLIHIRPESEAIAVGILPSRGTSKGGRLSMKVTEMPVAYTAT